MGKQNAPQQPHTKIAVDRTAEDYWSDYFEEYGVMFTREIPRRIASAIMTALHKRLAAAGKKVQLKVIRADLRPRAKAAIRDEKGRLQQIKTEGFFRAAVRDGNKTRTIRRQFCAAFDPKGNLISLDSVAI